MVYVRSTGRNQANAVVIEYTRWVMVRKRDKTAPAPEPVVPKLPERVEPSELGRAVPKLDLSAYDFASPGRRTAGTTTPSASASTTSTA